jgi:hypothetical protein
MRNSILSSPQLRPGVARKKESGHKVARRKGEIEFTEESGLLILMKRITRAQSTMESTVTSLTGWKPRMTDHVMKVLDPGSPILRNLDVREGKEKNLIDRGDTKTSLIMTSLGTASLM